MRTPWVTVRSSSRAWDPKVSIKLKAWPDYPGDTKPSIPGVEFKIYQDLDAAWADLQAGNLDVLDTIPDRSGRRAVQERPR